MKDSKWFFLFILGFILTSIGLTSFYGWIATSSCTNVCNYTCGSSCYVNCYDFCSRHRNYSSLVSGIIFVILGSILVFIAGPILTRRLYIRESKDSNSNLNSNLNSNSNSSSTKTKFKEIFKKLQLFFIHKQINVNNQENVEAELSEVVEVTNNDTTVADVTTTTNTNTIESENLREQLIAQSAQIKALNERLEQIELIPRETSAQEVIELAESQTLENNENENDNNNNNNNNNDNNDNNNG